jgi:hypothetical protein
MLREKLTYSNVMASIAVFVALGGTSYAAMTLPRDSVGARQLKTDSVRTSELRARSVTTNEIRDKSVFISDLSDSARNALKGAAGPAGPAGVSLRASLNSGGVQVVGNATGSTSIGGGKYSITFERDVTGCTPAATLARNPGGTVEDPGPGSIVVAIEGGKVAVETYDAAGAPTNLPFNLLVAC